MSPLGLATARHPRRSLRRGRFATIRPGSHGAGSGPRAREGRRVFARLRRTLRSARGGTRRPRGRRQRTLESRARARPRARRRRSAPGWRATLCEAPGRRPGGAGPTAWPRRDRAPPRAARRKRRRRRCVPTASRRRSPERAAPVPRSSYEGSRRERERSQAPGRALVAFPDLPGDLRAGPEETRLDGAVRELQGLPDLLVGEPVQVAQDEDLGEVFRDLRERGKQELRALLLQGLARRVVLRPGAGATASSETKRNDFSRLWRRYRSMQRLRESDTIQATSG